MGKSLADRYPTAARVFEEADDALGFKLSALCFEGPEEALKLTENTQPALLTVSTAALAVLREHGVSPDFVAGHSLGEYSALVAAGSLAFADAVRLVRNRGRYMQEAVPAGVGAMAALMRLPEDKLDEVLAAAAQGEVVSAANLNSIERYALNAFPLLLTLALLLRTPRLERWGLAVCGCGFVALTSLAFLGVYVP